MTIAITVLAIYLFFVFIGSDYIYKLINLFSDDVYFNSAVGNLVFYLLLNIIFVILYRKEIKRSWQSFKAQKLKPDVFLYGYLIVMAAAYVGQIILVLIGFGERESVNQQSIEILLKSKFAVVTIIGILIGPLVEEIVFRKAIFDIYDEKYHFNPTLICILSGLLFGLIHVILNIGEDATELIMAVPYAIQGFALAFIYQKYKNNLIVVSGVHVLYNLIAVILIFTV